jgi:hypothetical protein
MQVILRSDITLSPGPLEDAEDGFVQVGLPSFGLPEHRAEIPVRLAHRVIRTGSQVVKIFSPSPNSSTQIGVPEAACDSFGPDLLTPPTTVHTLTYMDSLILSREIDQAPLIVPRGHQKTMG